MDIMNGLNIYLAPLGGFVLVALDYTRNRTTDRIQKRIMFLITGASVLAVLCELTCDAYRGMPGAVPHAITYAACFVFFIAQLLAFSGIPLFLNYYINRNATQVQNLCVLLGVISAANFVALLLNISGDFYFFVTPDNYYMRGDMHYVRVAFSYSPLLVVIADFWRCRKNIGAQQAWLIVFFVIPAALSGFMDLAVSGSRILWPSFSLALLFAHLFMVKADYAVDSLTGIYSRGKCAEFFADIARTAKRRSYIFAMIDMDNFKIINDTLGHRQGDNALRDMAEILRSSIRQRDFLARYGGDEFLLILENRGDAAAILGRIQGQVEAFNAKKLRPYTLAFSLGYGLYEPGNMESPQEFLDRVDRAMYTNKAERRSS